MQVLSDDCRPALNVCGALLILPDFRKKRIQPVGSLATLLLGLFKQYSEGHCADAAANLVLIELGGHLLQLIDAAAQLPNLLPDAFLTLCVCGGALRLQPVQHGSFVQFQRLGMGADLAQYKLRQRHLIDGVPGTRAVAGGCITGAEIGNVLFGCAVLAALRLPVALKGCFTVGADELASEQEGLRRRVVRREPRPFPVDGLHFIPYLRRDDGFMQSLMFNEAYCRDISIKTRTSLDIKRRNGDFVGAFPVYGYMKSEENKNLLVPDPYASRVVQAIFRMRLDGTSALRIATVLNEMGILSPLAYKKNNGFPYAKHGYADKEDCKWSATTIIRILQDETYTGTLVQGKQTTPHFKLKEREDKPSSEWIRVEGTHEAIIQKHDFDLVQRLRRIDTSTSPKSDKVYLFSGILICGCCGCRMTRKTNRYKDKEYHYYYCPTGKKNGCTSSVMLKESDLIECVQDSLKGHIENVASLDALLSSISQERINRELAQEYAAQIRVNEKRVAQTEGFKAKLYENLVSGILTKEEFLSYKRKYNADIELFQKAIAEWNDKLTDVLENRSERNRWINHFMKFSTMEDIDRRVVMQLIRSIRVMGKDELHIEFNYQDEYQKAISLAEQIATKNEERMVS